MPDTNPTPTPLRVISLKPTPAPTEVPSWSSSGKIHRFAEPVSLSTWRQGCKCDACKRVGMAWKSEQRKQVNRGLDRLAKQNRNEMLGRHVRVGTLSPAALWRYRRRWLDMEQTLIDTHTDMHALVLDMRKRGCSDAAIALIIGRKPRDVEVWKTRARKLEEALRAARKYTKEPNPAGGD